MSTQHAVYTEYNGVRTRIGTANQAEDGSFVIVLGGFLVVGAAEGSSQSAGGGRSSGGGSGATFPPYGRNKGQPIYNAPMEQLEWYANNTVKSINDPSKARWLENNQRQLDALNAEIVRQGGTPVHVRDEYGQAPADDGIGRRRSDEQDDIPFN